MKKHAVPHNILDVEFKLFGSLTARQFGFVAVAFITALFIYFTGLPDIIRYPLIFVAVVSGLSLALLKVNGMPFSKWLWNFIISLLTSQRKVYRQSKKTPDALQGIGSPLKKDSSGSKENLSKTTKDSMYLRQLSSIFDTSARPQFDRNRSSNGPDESTLENVEDILNDERAKSLDKYFENLANENLSKYNLQKEPIGKESEANVQKIQTTNQRPVSTKSAEESTSQDFSVRSPGNVQPNKANQVSSLGKEEKRVASIREQIKAQAKANTDNNQSPNTTTKPDLTLRAKPDPNMTAKPNQIAGFVADQNNKVISGAQIFVRTQDGKMERSTKSNIKGKFLISSPLENGEYVLEIQKEGYNFPEYKLELKGERLPIYRYLAK